MRRKFPTVITAGLLGCSLTFAALTQDNNNGVTLTDDLKENAGLAAWSKVMEVFSHPRCTNCHVADGRPMWSGDHYGKTKPHGMNVGGNPDELLGKPGLMCTTCHTAKNSPVLHGPPGNDIWQLPPPEMAWWKKSALQICEQIKDPARNGDRSLEEIADHIANDSLEHRAFNLQHSFEP